MEVNDHKDWDADRDREAGAGIRKTKRSRKKNERENVLNIEILQGKKAAHCCGNENVEKKAIVSGEPFDSSTDKSHILEAVSRRRKRRCTLGTWL